MNYPYFQEELQQKGAAGLQGPVYLTDCCQAFIKDIELSETTSRIEGLKEAFPPKAELECHGLLDFKQIKNRIIFKLVNAKRNAEQLADMPHLPFLDLAIVFCIVLKMSPSGTISIPIHNEHLKLWNVDTETLDTHARRNGLHILPPTLEAMASILKEQGASVKDECDRNPTFVLSNEKVFWGAASLLYDGILQTVGDLLHMNYFVLPSSIHETIIYPDGPDISTEELNETIQFANENIVDPPEILSDHAYYYDRKQGRLVIP